VTTQPDLTKLRDAQFLHAAATLTSATEYYSDSTIDPVTAALDAANQLNFLAVDNDHDGFHRWANDTDNGLPTYCTEGLCNELYDYLDDNDE
jgi:hypothetical protein